MTVPPRSPPPPPPPPPVPAPSPPFTGIDAGLYLAATDATADSPSAWFTRKTRPADAPASSAPAVLFEPVPLPDFYAWLTSETARLQTASVSSPDPSGSVQASQAAYRFPRLDLPTSPATREFLKQLPLAPHHAAIAAWIAAQSARHVRPLLMIRAGDYTKAALDLRHLCTQHRSTAGAPRLALILDDFSADDAPVTASTDHPPTAALDTWQAGVRLGNHLPVWLLARGLPGSAPHEHGRLPDEVSPATRARAEERYHHAVGELGTERILFGSGLDAHDPDRARRQAILAAWFRAPRDWLDEDSVELLFGANQTALLAPLPGAPH